MAFACRPRLIVLDEPTTGLDVTTQAHVLDTVRELAAAHRVAALYVSHDLAVVGTLAERVAVMYAGRIVELGRHERAVRVGRAPVHAPAAAGDPAPLGPPRADRHPRARAVAGQRARRLRLRAALHVWSMDALHGCELPRLRALRPSSSVRCLRAEEVRASVGVPLGRRRASTSRGRAPATPCSRSTTSSPATARSRSCTTSTSSSPRASASRSSASRARARPRWRARSRGLHRDRSGEILLRGEPLARRSRQRPRESAGSDPVRLPEPVRLAQPAQDDRADRAPAARASSARATGARPTGGSSEMLERVSLAAQLRRPLSRPALRRRAPARRDRPRARVRPGGAGLRRGHLGARRQRAGGDRRAARRAAARPRAGDALRHAQPAARALDRPARRGHERGPDRRARRRSSTCWQSAHRRVHAAPARPTRRRSRPRPRDAGRRCGRRQRRARLRGRARGVRAEPAEHGETAARSRRWSTASSVVDLWGGVADPAAGGLGQRTCAVIFSGTKGVVATALLLLVERGELDLDAPRGRASGPSSRPPARTRSRSRSCCSHCGGLPGLSAPVRPRRPREAMARALAAQAPMRARRGALLPRAHVRLAGRRAHPARRRAPRPARSCATSSRCRSAISTCASALARGRSAARRACAAARRRRASS